ncbi:DNA-methyltransferase [Rubritalea spongiae]|uniref:Methyltransferase n=1 Tax=Rubritalea spongiae TaxID=430797 RepID=A0ABW5DZF0_9BACT
MDFKIHINDCLTALQNIPSESVDALITDPPYCSGGFTEAGKMAAKTQGITSSSDTLQRLGWFQNDNMTTAGLIWMLREMMIQAERILKPNTSALVFCDWRMVPLLAPALESSGMMYRNMIIWDKLNGGLGNGFRPRHEVILHFIKGKATFYDRTKHNVLPHKRVTPKNKQHPTEKPVALLEDLITMVTDKGHTVVDPFMGSGSTGQACKNLNRKFIGIEKSEFFATNAKEKLDL